MVAYRMRCINMQVNLNYCHGNKLNEINYRSIISTERSLYYLVFEHGLGL
jgi:hypothetical protein